MSSAKSMGLIKSTNAPPALTPFSMRDVEEHAKSLLLRARQAAERLLAEAQREGEEIKKRAHAEGLAEGMCEGLDRGLAEGRAAGTQQALDENRAALGQALAALTSAGQALDASRADLESAALQEVVELAIAIARRVTKRQGVIDPAVLTENLREAMKLVVHAGDVKVAFHPTQRQTLQAALPALKLEFPKLHHVELVDDSAISPGGCRVFAGHGQIDADLGEQLDRVAIDLLPEPVEADAEAYAVARLKKLKKETRGHGDKGTG
jgi:flagellar assembly protein FliH